MPSRHLLAGVPVGIKDLVYTKGIRTTSGSIIYKDFVPTEDDVVVERLKAAGSRHHRQDQRSRARL
jgi:aspartyl-tRNA(Asn)/glutamyl-tRNA(Gln) amidotransferase subunit A